MRIPAGAFAALLLTCFAQASYSKSNDLMGNYYFDQIYLSCGALKTDSNRINCFNNLHNQLKTQINTGMGKLAERDRIHALNTKGIAVLVLKENCKATFTGWISQQCVVNADLSFYNYLSEKKE